jgi:sugar lactone lactonase YvrE
VSASGGGYRILGMLPYIFSFQPVDASGATIIGPGTPVVTVTSASNDVTATAVTGQSGSYTLKVVTQSTAPVSLSVQSTGGATVAVPIVTAPEYFVCDAGSFSIRAYDINGSTAAAIISDGLTFTNTVNVGVAIDAAGHVWISDEDHGLRSYNPGSTTALTSITVPESSKLAFGPTGTLYAESYVSPNMYLKGYNASSGALLTTSSVIGATTSGPLAIDSLGQLWFGDEYQTNTVKGFTSAGTQIGSLTISTGNPQNALAFDASGHLWVGANATMSAYNTSTGAIVAGSTITNSITTPVAIRFDPAGNIIELDNYQETMHVYSSAGALLRTITLPGLIYALDMAIAP